MTAEDRGCFAQKVADRKILRDWARGFWCWERSSPQSYASLLAMTASCSTWKTPAQSGLRGPAADGSSCLRKTVLDHASPLLRWESCGCRVDNL